MAVNPYLLLYIEPVNSPSKEPVIDELTRKMTAAFRKAQSGGFRYPSYNGGHIIVSTWDEFISAFEKKQDITYFQQSNLFTINGGWMGWHDCSCGFKSTSHDYLLPNNEITNSLCIHYLAFHRDEISEEQLERVCSLDDGEEEPTIEELGVPQEEELAIAKTREEFKQTQEYEYVVLENPVRDHLKIKRE